MKYVRFMGYSELEKLLKGENLVNNTDWRKRAMVTDSVGFCFFDDSIGPEERLEYLTGVCDLDCVIVCECANEKKLRKSHGRYRDPEKDTLLTLRPVMMDVPEYSITSYNRDIMRPVRVGVVVDPYYDRKIEWQEVKTEKSTPKGKQARIIVEHPNGYTGVLYGKSSLSVRLNDKEILHTGSRNINTSEELYALLEGVPEMMEKLRNGILRETK